MKKVLSFLNALRLAAFPLAYGLSGALIGGTLNRIMIADLGVPASLAALLFAVPLMVSPLRVWLGYRSDGFPILGKRREPYILLGALLIGAGILAAAGLTAGFTRTSPAFVLLGLAAFALYGAGRNLGHNTFQALLSDRFSTQVKTRVITLFEVATLLGMVMGSGAIGKALEDYSPQRLMSTALGVALAVLALAALAALGQERTSSLAQEAARTARAVPFNQALRLALGDPQVR
ncbi:MAG: PucC family protein, partial [Chloroflexota bacterium]